MITESVAVAAAENLKGKEMMELLLSTQPDIEITESVLVAAVMNRSCKEVMELLLSTHHPNRDYRIHCGGR